MNTDNPELPPEDYREYANTDYWEERYKKCPNDEFEWYYDYESLASIFEDHINLAFHYQGPIEGIDISPTVIEEMKKKHQQKTEQIASVEYKVVDATKMDYDHSFGAVIDKGTLDALNCGEFKIVEDFVTCMEYPFD
ncbi:hypothetical protein WA171_006655 [Blastocystis sp. BT1]